MDMAQELKIGIAGLGNVGASVVRLLQKHRDMLAARCGRPVVITAVSARSKRDRGIDLSGITWHDNPVSLAADANVDVVVELIGGASGVAFDLVSAALKAGKPVVTANKALLAGRGAEIIALLKQSTVTVSFEAAVAGGIPAIKGLREGLAANHISAVYGILNGTCNFILTEMRETGRSFADVLKDAQDKGYAEADPSFDIDGVDTAHKLSILAGLAFGVVPDVENISVKGIRAIAALDISFADELGYRIKLLGIARRTAHGIEQSVEPCLVPKSAPVSAIDGPLNAVYVDSDFAGKTLFTGAGAGGDATASAVVSDIIDIARGRALPLMGIAADAVGTLSPADIDNRVGSYYFRLIVLDQPGVVADVSAILRDHKISMESMLQRGRDPGQPVSLILTTHETTEGEMKKAIDKIAQLKSVSEPPHVMRIEGF
jgi:homoserine dehydrogenase